MGSSDKGLVFNVQKFSIHDGAGIRTLVFMKGCPLRCVWCCNPESQRMAVDIFFVRPNCIGCGHCVAACDQGGIAADGFYIDRSRCLTCGACADACHANAKKRIGRWMRRRDLVQEIEKDAIVYRNSGGGVTVGGGEPTLQPGFVAALLQDCRSLCINTAIETCGYGDWNDISAVFAHADHVFFDLKCMDEDVHTRITGVSNASILENAQRVLDMGKRITFRIPLIPGLNDCEDNIAKTADFVASAGGDAALEFLSYHRLGEDKFSWMDREYALSGTQGQLSGARDHAIRIARDRGCTVLD
jgi:pyruvate formate lyase activating enzyme